MKRSLGIDLGTTNTVAAVQGAALCYATDPDAGSLLPSVVAFPPSGATLVGTVARRRRLIDARNTLYSIKRFIGRKWESPDMVELRKRFPFNMGPAPDGTVAFQTRAGTCTPVDVSALILKTVLAEVGGNPADVSTVITVPAAFRPEQRRATQAAARQAGLVNVRLLEEPCAAAIAYTSRVKAGIVGVYDLGGGTFDFAIVDCTTRPFRILANDGDQYLGGDDIDAAIARWAADAMLRAHNWDLQASPDIWGRLVAECEAAKIRLSTMESTVIDLTQVDPIALERGGARQRSIPFQRQALQQAAGDVVRKSLAVCEDVLARHGKRFKDLDALVLAGGGTRLPSIRSSLQHVFGRELIEACSPLEVVATGASMAAEAFARDEA